jgi:hypothetical protein
VSGARSKPGRLGLYVEGYRACLLELGYSPLSVTRSLTALGYLGRWMERDGVDVDQLDAAAVMAFLAVRYPRRSRSRAIHVAERQAHPSARAPT